MTPLTWFFVYAFAAIGHMAFWIALFNRVHSTRLNNRRLRRASYPFIGINLIALPFLLIWIDSTQSSLNLFPQKFWKVSGISGGYLYCSLVFAIYTTIVWCSRKISQWRGPRSLIGNRATRKDFSNVAAAAERSSIEKFFAAIPGNQIYQCVVEEREFRLEGISACFDGLTLTHLSDFHFTGKICREYFEQVIETANNLKSDLILITGDIIDSHECWSWIPEVLGRLRAEKGICFILGNHDERVHAEEKLRDSLNQLGFVDVSNRWVQVAVADHMIHLSGNELPWFGDSMTISEVPTDFSKGDLRVLLSHSPDQWKWGRDFGFDLVVAGHTHGGQIRIPLVGPVLSPSRYGVKYASGMFEKEKKVLVVSRGVSGEEPIRFHCPPEVGKITIRSNG